MKGIAKYIALGGAAILGSLPELYFNNKNAKADTVSIWNLAESGSGIGSYNAELDQSSVHPSATMKYNSGLDNVLDTGIHPSDKFFVLFSHLQEEGNPTNMVNTEKNFTQYAQVDDVYDFSLSFENRIGSSTLVNNTVNFSNFDITGNPYGVVDYDISFQADTDVNGSFADPWDYSFTGKLSEVMATQDQDIGYWQQYIPSWFDHRNGQTDVYGNLSLTAIGAPQIDADFDDDGDVDGFDFLRWQTGFGMGPGALNSDGDTNVDTFVNTYDFEMWEQQFGTTGLGGSSAATAGSNALQAQSYIASSNATPEPSTLVYAGLAGLLGAGYRGMRRGRSVGPVKESDLEKGIVDYDAKGGRFGRTFVRDNVNAYTPA